MLKTRLMFTSGQKKTKSDIFNFFLIVLFGFKGTIFLRMYSPSLHLVPRAVWHQCDIYTCISYSFGISVHILKYCSTQSLEVLPVLQSELLFINRLNKVYHLLVPPSLECFML